MCKGDVMTQARKAQKRLLSETEGYIYPGDCDGCIGFSNEDEVQKYYFSDKSMIVYFSSCPHWPEVWTISDRVRKLDFSVPSLYYAEYEKMFGG